MEDSNWTRRISLNNLPSISASVQGERDLEADQERRKEPRLEVGKVYQAHIEEAEVEGRGLASLNSYIVLVPDAKPGENVEVKITKLFGRVAFGKIVRR